MPSPDSIEHEPPVLEERHVSFGGVDLDIEIRTAVARRATDFVLASLAEGNLEATERAWLHLLPGSEERHTEVHRRDDRVLHGYGVEDLADILMGEVVFQLANVGSAGLMLHAAVLANHGRGVLIPAKSGEGKSTLAAWLMSSGYDFLTDELAFIADADTSVAGFARPIRLRPQSARILGARLGDRLQGAEVWESNRNLLLPPTVVRHDGLLPSAEIGIVLFAGYDGEGDGRLRRMSRADAGSHLMQCLINARNLDEHGFREIVRIARSVPAFEIRYRRCEEVEQALDSWRS